MSNYGQRRRTNIKPGDWTCSCGEHNFASRSVCRSCNSAKPPGAGASRGGFKPGDWQCRQCDEHNFASRSVCRKCEATKPPGAGFRSDSSKFKPGDWACPDCKEHNFASRTECRKCGVGKPEHGGVQMLRGDWLCDECSEHNFASRTECRKCGNEKPEEDEDEEYGGGNAGGNRGGNYVEMMQGDWMCPQCNEHNFGSRTVCRSCDAPKARAECSVCMEVPADAVFPDCGHVSCCLPCASNLTQCPMCRTTVTQQPELCQY
eukprot:CAMPEP_0114618150 /NCGR_PEP_ID=MMETSP0168-20121206/7558_1 /TAXON_ID=95228 ORGANISM="Vannella sp., Strain DIVA3 517/6/12" /NCGR_SAMPLE_ID=MMETSP0168 /ASSEMBLY_ACC=CAM_ASM_000044 /LENGTH=260 /DNA_ID=CAMNT_0001829295 /DNA_START=57 /DNA_END=839 /DNA_ORIENTATION=-